MSENKIVLAQELAKYFHEGQKYGIHDYYEYHLEGVVEVLSDISLTLLQDDTIVVALLHDIVEDTPCEVETIENIFGYSVGDSVNRLTKCGLNPSDYLDDICGCYNARLVKFADSLFNYRECVKCGDLKRAEKYKHNLGVLHCKATMVSLEGVF